MRTEFFVFVERKINDKWEVVPTELGIDDPWHPGEKTWQSAKNEPLFGLLAGVGDPFDALIEPRGLPEDASQEIKNDFEEDDFHTPTYYTLPELLTFRDQKFKHIGYLCIEDYIKFKTGEKLKNTAYKYSKPYKGSELVSNSKMDRISSLSGMFGDTDYCTEVEFEVSAEQISDVFWKSIVDKMAELSPENPDNVRMTVFFKEGFIRPKTIVPLNQESTESV